MPRPAYGEWLVDDSDAELLTQVDRDDEHVRVVRCIVRDGWLRCVTVQNPHWRLTLSHWPRRKRRARRLPTWTELLHAREYLVPPNVTIVTIVPHVDDLIGGDPAIVAYQINAIDTNTD